MGTGIRSGLRKRFERAQEQNLFIWPESEPDANRLLRAYKRGDLVRPAPRIYALRENWDELESIERERRTIKTLAKLHPNWVFSYTSAAIMHNLEIGYGQLGTIHLACGRMSHTRSIQGVQRHTIHNDTFVQIDGVNVTSLERTAFDCMRTSRFPRALAIADSALRVSNAEANHFVDAFSCLHGGHHNKSRPIEIIAFADSRAENGGESVARATMIKLGFKVPELQKVVSNVIDPSKPYRVDFYWELGDSPVAGELDGHDKYIDPAMTDGRDVLEVLTAERLRESRISGSNIKILRFSFAEVRDYPVFTHLLNRFGIPGGNPVPAIALT